MTDDHWMRLALDLAKHAADLNEVPVGAVIVLDDKLIGSGFNQPISSQDPTAHAEIIAIRNAAKILNNYRLVNTTMYVTLEPCAMCAGALIHARIKRLVFGASDPKAGTANQFNHTVNCSGGILADDSSNLLREFFLRRR